MKLKKEAKGTLQTTFRTIIPLLLVVSTSRITNGNYVPHADREHASGYVVSVHILMFFTFGLVVPGAITRIIPNMKGVGPE